MLFIKYSTIGVTSPERAFKFDRVQVRVRVRVSPTRTLTQTLTEP